MRSTFWGVVVWLFWCGSGPFIYCSVIVTCFICPCSVLGCFRSCPCSVSGRFRFGVRFLWYRVVAVVYNWSFGLWMISRVFVVSPLRALSCCTMSLFTCHGARLFYDLCCGKVPIWVYQGGIWACIPGSLIRDVFSRLFESSDILLFGSAQTLNLHSGLRHLAVVGYRSSHI